MKLPFKRWLLTTGVSLMAVASVACSGVTTPGADGSPTPGASNQPVNNPTLSTVTPSANIDELTAAEIIAAQEQHLVSVYERVVPSVVHIVTQTGTFGGSEGSGWVWDEQGHIVTNFHVVQDARMIRVRFADGAEYDAEVVGVDQDSDIAVIKINATGLQPAEVGESSSLKPGQFTVAVGNPFGQDFTMTTGIVSAVGRLIESGFNTRFAIPSVIQTDAAINPGNSGGPLLDRDGRVIGVNTQIRSQSGQSSGVGFAVPVDLVKRVVPSLIDDGRHQYAYLGVKMVTVDRVARERGSLPADLKGALVTELLPDSPALGVGLQGDSRSPANPAFDGDVILSVDGTATPTTEHLIAYLAIYTSPGEEVVLDVFRDGQTIQVPVTLGSRNEVSS